MTFGDPSQKLWKQSAPLWLIDVTRARIVWANQACLDFSGARSLDDLRRLRFDAHSPFIGQLASLMPDRDDHIGVREQLRFPSAEGVFVLDCLCRYQQINEEQAGVLVELVADRGLIEEGALVPESEEPELQEPGPQEPGPTEPELQEDVQNSAKKTQEQQREDEAFAKSTTKVREQPLSQHQNGTLTQPEPPKPTAAKPVHAQAQISPRQKKSAPPAAVLHFDEINGANGFEIKAGSVDEEDLQTLREIARLINGPALLEEGDELVMDNRPAITTRGKPPPSDVAEGATKNHSSRSLINNRPDYEDLRTSDDTKRAPEPKVSTRNGAAKQAPGRGERNYFLESLPVALAIAMGGRLMRANETFLYAFGFASESELRRAGGLAALFPQSDNGVLRAVDTQNAGAQCERSHSRSGQVTTKCVSRSGRERRVPVAFRNVSTGQDIVQILILHEDALKREKLKREELGQTELGRHEAVNDRDEPVRSSNPGEGGRALSERTFGQDSIDFLANVSHEVRTPLNSIIGFSELMKDERFGAVDANKFREYASDIHSSAMHALSLINDLLDITKIIAGKSDLEFEKVSINKLVRQIVSSMRTQASDRHIRLETNFQAGLPALFADPRSLNQIFLNLLSNAIKFTEKGGQVIVSSQLLEEGGVLLSVIDTGIGMNAEQLVKALEPFEQIEPVPSAKGHELPSAQRGTGLGLPLTKALVKGNQAGFSIQSTSGEGTRIEIYFPPERLVEGAVPR
ncbi:MAG: ATP-binding protein [Hyphomicrobiaceae bacterium]|nr:ATP-binding protein [Hyphomicrobiaceae bacterium]